MHRGRCQFPRTEPDTKMSWEKQIKDTHDDQRHCDRIAADRRGNLRHAHSGSCATWCLGRHVDGCFRKRMDVLDSKRRCDGQRRFVRDDEPHHPQHARRQARDRLHGGDVQRSGARGACDDSRLGDGDSRRGVPELRQPQGCHDTGRRSQDHRCDSIQGLQKS